MPVGPVHAFLIAIALLGTGALAAAYRRDLRSALAGVATMAAGAGLAMAAASRFSAARSDPLSGQEFAVVLSVATLAAVILGVGLARMVAGRPGGSRVAPGRPPARRASAGRGAREARR